MRSALLRGAQSSVGSITVCSFSPQCNPQMRPTTVLLLVVSSKALQPFSKFSPLLRIYLRVFELITEGTRQRASPSVCSLNNLVANVHSHVKCVPKLN